MTTIYEKAAEILFGLLDEAWASQETMDTAWATSPLGKAMPLDRTKHADYLIRYLFNLAWKQAFVTLNPGATAQQAIRPLNADILKVAVEMLTFFDDYNLLTQVLPNLVPHALVMDRVACSKEMETALAALPPEAVLMFNKGAKPKDVAALDASVQDQFRKAQGLAKVAKTFENFTPPSWRITPHGKTAALTDSAGVSNLPALADPYVNIYSSVAFGEAFKTAYITWTGGSVSPTVTAVLEGDEPGKFTVADMPNGRDAFVSESGGTMLGQVMLARGLAYDAWSFWALWCKERNLTTYPPFYVLTKLASIRLVGPADLLEAMEQDFMRSGVPGSIPGFTWSWDKRPEFKPAPAPEPEPIVE